MSERAPNNGDLGGESVEKWCDLKPATIEALANVKGSILLASLTPDSAPRELDRQAYSKSIDDLLKLYRINPKAWADRPIALSRLMLESPVASGRTIRDVSRDHSAGEFVYDFAKYCFNRGARGFEAVLSMQLSDSLQVDLACTDGSPEYRPPEEGPIIECWARFSLIEPKDKPNN
ncbi:MAG: hypothetical protein JWO35_239 [Candidatus Saccharibacteria bacterium]|nr:hypothetical protein [Candidatus Saccharibacteria bacterium]